MKIAELKRNLLSKLDEINNGIDQEETIKRVSEIKELINAKLSKTLWCFNITNVLFIIVLGVLIIISCLIFLLLIIM